MSGNGLAVEDRASGVQVVRAPHVSHQQGALAPVATGSESRGSHWRQGWRAVAAKLGRFLLHFLEMLLAMMVGMGIFNVLVRAVLVPLGYTLGSNSDLYVIGMAIFMVVPMAAWMRFRGMASRPIAEMSAAMVGLAILLVCAAWLGFLERSSLNRLEHSLMLPVMLVPMFVRLSYYTAGHKAHHAHVV